MLRSQSDERLVGLARAGNERAFAAIVERYRPELQAFARGLCSDGRSEDVVQQAFLSAFAALSAGAEVRHLRGWLYRIVRNAANRPAGPLCVPLDRAAVSVNSVEDVVAAARTGDEHSVGAGAAPGPSAPGDDRHRAGWTAAGGDRQLDGPVGGGGATARPPSQDRSARRGDRGHALAGGKMARRGQPGRSGHGGAGGRRRRRVVGRTGDQARCATRVGDAVDRRGDRPARGAGSSRRRRPIRRLRPAAGAWRSRPRSGARRAGGAGFCGVRVGSRSGGRGDSCRAGRRWRTPRRHAYGSSRRGFGPVGRAGRWPTREAPRRQRRWCRRRRLGRGWWPRWSGCFVARELRVG